MTTHKEQKTHLVVTLLHNETLTLKISDGRRESKKEREREREEVHYIIIYLFLTLNLLLGQVFEYFLIISVTN